MKKKLSKKMSAGTADDSSTKDEDMQVSPAIAKPFVSRRFISDCKFCNMPVYIGDVTGAYYDEEKVNHYICECLSNDA